MMYLRGPQVVRPRAPETIAHAALIAAELGADIAKIPEPDEPGALRDVAAGCPVPLIVAGGPRLHDEEQLLDHVDSLMSAGVAGLAMGRNIFEAPAPGALTRRLAGRLRREARRRAVDTRALDRTALESAS